MGWYENKKKYNKEWGQENTKALSLRYNKSDEIWEMVEILKQNGIKMNAFFKEAVMKEFKNQSKKKPS